MGKISYVLRYFAVFSLIFMFKIYVKCEIITIEKGYEKCYNLNERQVRFNSECRERKEKKNDQFISERDNRCAADRR